MAEEEAAAVAAVVEAVAAAASAAVEKIGTRKFWFPEADEGTFFGSLRFYSFYY